MISLFQAYGIAVMLLAVMLTVWWSYPRFQAMNALREEARARQRRKRAEEGR